MELGLQLARTFADGQAYLQGYIAHLRRIYDIRHFIFEDDQIDAYQLQYCSRMHGFLLVLPYSVESGEISIFLTWSFSHGRLAWDAASAGIGQAYTEVRTNLENIFQRFLPKITMLTATPIASIENRFTHNGKTVRHFGLAYACAATNLRNIHEDNPDLRGVFLPVKEVGQLLLADSWNKDIIPYACERITTLVGGAQGVEREITEQKQHELRYQIHRIVVKHFLVWFDRVLCFVMRRVPRSKLRNIVLNAVPENCESLLDVSAGDHRDSIEFGRKAKIVVLNDVAWRTLSSLVDDKKLRKYSGVDFVFVNEDFLRAPFQQGAFDAVFCRNTLHHLSTVEEIESFLNRLKMWARRTVIIAEVLEPLEHPGVWDWLRDQYYRRFLHDAGTSFLRAAQLAGLIERTFLSGGWRCEQSLHKTVGGQIALYVVRHVP